MEGTKLRDKDIKILIEGLFGFIVIFKERMWDCQ